MLERRDPLEEFPEDRPGRLSLPWSQAIEAVSGDNAPARLCQVTDLIKRGVKGPSAAEWLRARQLPVPADRFRSEPVGSGGRVTCLDRNEHLIEFRESTSEVSDLYAALDAVPESLTRIEREDATFFLAGPAALQVLAQTCAIDFREPKYDYLVLTSVAGVSCGILPWTCEGSALFQLTVDPSYARYLWSVLSEIVDDVPEQT